MEKFYDVLSSMKLGEIAKIVEASFETDYSDVNITNLGSLEKFDSSSIIYLALGNAVTAALDKSAEYKEKLKQVKAAACFVKKEHASLLPVGVIPVIVADPKLAFIKLTHIFYKDKTMKFKGISELSSVAKTIEFVDKASVHIGDFSVIEDEVKIGKNVYIGHGVKIKVGVQIGDDCVIRDNAVISHTIIGNDVMIGESTIIGGDGFGWHSGSFGHIYVPHLGNVILNDRVSIGNNTCIDRGAVGSTVIGEGTKIDNLIQIGHNVQIGKNCIFAGMCGVAGSTTIGNWVLVGAMAGISGHLSIGDGVQIGAGSGVINNLKAGEKVSGYPSLPIPDFLKQTVLLRRLVKKKKVD